VSKASDVCARKGFRDSHLHASWHAVRLFSADVAPDASFRGETPEEHLAWYQARLRTWMAAHPDAPIIRGFGFDPAVFLRVGADLLCAEALDAVCADRPVVLRSFCFHYAWCNSLALQMSGVGTDTPDFKTARIYRDPDGVPTGLFKEIPAVDMLFGSHAPFDFMVSEYREALLDFCQIAETEGITCVFDALCTDNAVLAYEELAKSSRLGLTVRACLYADPEVDLAYFDRLPPVRVVRPPGAASPATGGSFSVDAVKFFLDGTSFGFWLLEPYASRALAENGLPTDWRGQSIWDTVALTSAFKKCAAAGYDIHVHAMGDAAFAQALDAFEGSGTGSCGTIAHIMLARPEDILRMGQLGITATVMPQWMCVDDYYYYYYEYLFGRERAARVYPLKSLINAGVRVNFGSDYPVTLPISSAETLQMAQTRTLPPSAPDYARHKDTPLAPTECLTREEAIRCYVVE